MTIEPHADGWCIHFQSVLHKQCKLGIPYADLWDEKRKLPCILDEGATKVCPHLTRPTPEQIAASEAQIKEALENFFKAMHSGTCPHCGKTLEWERKVGRCVYGSCGCRLWQGKARSKEQLKALQAKAKEENNAER
jgi:hypothetical protein